MVEHFSHIAVSRRVDVSVGLGCRGLPKHSDKLRASARSSDSFGKAPPVREIADCSLNHSAMSFASCVVNTSERLLFF